MKAMLSTLAAAALLATAAPAQAGRNCEAQLPTARNVQRSLQLAERTARALDASGAQVVVLARAGQDLGKYGLRWSHLGWAYKLPAAAAEAAAAPAAPSIGSAAMPAPAAVAAGGTRPATWRVVHKLNHCGSATAALYRQGLGEFLLDDLFDYQAAYAVPTPDVQARLLALLADNSQVQQLHTPAYNMVAYPWAQQYQQSNQWAIETLAYAMESGATTRERAQAWLRFKAYEPTVLRISPLVRLGARMTAANVAFDDHPNDKRYSDRIETVTVDSVFEWLARAGLAGPVQVQR
jgi:hypothetical protein